MGGSPTGASFCLGSPNLASTISIDWPLEGRSSPDGSLGGASVIASISRVSAFAESMAREIQAAMVSCDKLLFNFRNTLLSLLERTELKELLAAI